MMDLSPWLTTDEAAEYLRTTRGAILHHVARGNLKPTALGGRGRFQGHRFTREALDAFVLGKAA